MVDSRYLLTDEQMIQFITKGYVVLQNELPQQLHQQVMDSIYNVLHEEGNPGNNILPRVPDIQQFFDTPVVKGALTSVLGPDYYMHPHRHCHYNQPGNQTPGGGNWHKDGYWSSMRSHRPWWAMIFYYTQDITEDLGPTAVMPGTQYYEKFIGDRGETVLPTGKAGTMVLVHFDMWHKASLNTTDLDRYMLKFQFVRLRAPQRPSWNHTDGEFVVPQGTPALHHHLWTDVWDWLRGVRAEAPSGIEADSSRLQQLENGLMAESADIRGQAADDAGRYGANAAALVPQLGRMLGDPVETAALNASYALGHMGPEGVQELLAQLSGESNPIAMRAAYGLQGAGAGAAAGLIEALHHPNDRRRALAAFVLGMIGSDAVSAVPALLASMNDESEWVRRNAIEALGMIVQPAERIVPALARALEDSVTNETSGEAPSADSYSRNQDYITNKIGYTAALSLLRIGKEGDPAIMLRALEIGLTSRDRYVRAYAAEALTCLRTPEAVDTLIRFYRSSRWCPDTHKASTF
ncbi:HEAT repeat domain-containing protein [Paenibacillus spongiae]|uniref:HEAT repeat domain-containing protein n=1 Tax=Paenibacillus spongiae TaxID=2909671 RepID=A0ABY5S7K6_9BACL|nr:HEAT repeat domain-containing protein [Paenibacillus spongiae]UVI28780.1 HEAT repeat domain-containing protein [Paenibacillus spongiae]